MIRHVECVAQAGHARQLRRRDAQARARCLLDDFGRSIRLPTVHAGAGNDDKRRGLRQVMTQRQRDIRYVEHTPCGVAGKPYDLHTDGIAQA
jgi:hypothetical protein